MFGTSKAELKATVAIQDCTIRLKDVLLKSRAKQIESLTRSRDELAAKVAELTAEVGRLRAPAPTETSMPHVPQPYPMWTEWSGGECPVPFEALVDVRFRAGNVMSATQALAHRWNHSKGSGDIVAYRVIP